MHLPTQTAWIHVGFVLHFALVALQSAAPSRGVRALDSALIIDLLRIPRQLGRSVSPIYGPGCAAARTGAQRLADNTVSRPGNAKKKCNRQILL
jgi:hypothetical protein